MPRKKYKKTKQETQDLIYSSKLISKFINIVMLDGKKTVAEKIVYGAIEKLAKEVNESNLVAFEKCIKNATPLLEVKSRRVGGSTYQVPIEVRSSRGIGLAMRWLVKNSRAKSGKSMIDLLSAEMIDSYNKVGSTIKKREDTHKMAEANKAFAHFRW